MRRLIVIVAFALLVALGAGMAQHKPDSHRSVCRGKNMPAACLDRGFQTNDYGRFKEPKP